MPAAMARRGISLFLAVASLVALGSNAHDATHGSADAGPDSESWSLHDFVDTDTVQAIMTDKSLRRAYGAVVGVCADTSRNLAEQFEAPQLSDLSESLNNYLQDLASGPGAEDEAEPNGDQSGDHVNSHAKRAGLLGSLLPGADGDAKNDTGGGGGLLGGLAKGIGGLLGGGEGGNGGEGGEGGEGAGGLISKAVSGLFANVANMTGPALAGAGFFGGIGAGAGATQGLQLASANASAASGASVAQENNMESTGLNSAIQSATMGLTATALRALRSSSALQMPDFGPVASALGGGLGGGAASGLGLKEASAPGPGANGSGLNDLAGNFAFGLSKSFTQGANVSGLVGQMGGKDGASMTDMLLKIAGPAATGLGRGIGSGAAVGLGLQPDAEPPESAAGGGVDVGAIAQGFASGLTSRFLANGTASKALSGLAGGGGSAGGLAANLDVSRIANGLARGLLAGVGDGAQSLGGVSAIFSGKAKAEPEPGPDTRVAFDDSVGGAATGFGQGLGNEAVLTIQKLLAGGADDAAAPAGRKRSTASVLSTSRLAPRQSSGGIDLSGVLSPEAVSSAIQGIIDTVNCEGIGGLALVALGVVKSGTISAGGLDPNTTRFLKDLIPKGVITLSKDGNTYQVDGPRISKALDGSIAEAANGLTINGSNFTRFLGLLVAHIFFGIAAFAVLLPLVVTLHSSRNMLERLRLQKALPAWSRTAEKVIWVVVAASLILILVFGLLPGPKGRHFQSAHGVLGLISLIVASAAVPLYLLSSPSPLAKFQKLPTSLVSDGVNQLLLLLALPTIATGFADLSVISLCLTRVVPLELAVMLGVGLGSMLIISQAVSGLDLLLQWRERRQTSRAADEKPFHIEVKRKATG